MSDDLVKRLVSLADCDARAGEPLGKCMREAADRIEALEAQLAAHKMVASIVDDEWCASEDEVDRLKAQLAAHEWQPIETAPSVHCLLFGNTRYDQNIVSSGWVAQNGMTYVDGGHLCRATHWMPLPEPPKAD